LNMLNVGVDVHHFRPVDSDRLQFHFDAICKYYDNDVWVAYTTLNVNEHTVNRGKPGSYFRPEAPATPKWMVHEEPLDMQQNFTMREHCVDCRQPTKFWLPDKHTPLCPDCCEKRNKAKYERD
jgi:hypothetical protein